MKLSRSPKLGWVVLLAAFALLTILIPFGHREKSPLDEARCPACHLLSFLLQTAPAQVAFYLTFVLLSLIRPDGTRRPGLSTAFRSVLRAPPAV